MPILGSSGSQSGRLPGVVSGVSAVAGDGQAVVSFTEPAYKGKGSIIYTVTSSPGNITATGSSSPITVSGLTNGTEYTFTVRASSSGVGAAASSASSGVTPVLPVYALSQTFNSSGTYTVPSGKSQVAVFVMGGGSSGGGGSAYGAGSGGRTAALVGFKDYSVTPGQNYTVTVASSNGTSSFGNIASADTGVVASPGGATTASGRNGGGQGAGGQSGPSINLGDANLSTFSSGGSGGGGARGVSAVQNEAYGNITKTDAGSPGSGVSGGGNGGAGGNWATNAGFGNANAGSPGNSANQRGAGGGGGGMGGYGNAMDPDPQYGSYPIHATGGGGGGGGGAGQVVVYVR